MLNINISHKENLKVVLATEDRESDLKSTFKLKSAKFAAIF